MRKRRTYFLCQKAKGGVGLLACLVIAGCTAGSHLYFHPTNAHHNCSEVDFSASTITVAHDTWFYVGALPLGRSQDDRTQGNLQVDFFARSTSAIELSVDDLHILDIQARTEYVPIRLLISKQFYLEKTEKYYTNYQAEFAIKNNELEEFDLVFHLPLGDCDIPPIHYRKGASRHYAAPIN